MIVIVDRIARTCRRILDVYGRSFASRHLGPCRCRRAKHDGAVSAGFRAHRPLPMSLWILSQRGHKLDDHCGEGTIQPGSQEAVGPQNSIRQPPSGIRGGVRPGWAGPLPEPVQVAGVVVAQGRAANRPGTGEVAHHCSGGRTPSMRKGGDVRSTRSRGRDTPGETSPPFARRWSSPSVLERVSGSSRCR